MSGYYEDKDAILARLRKVEGQIRGLQKMVEADVYCIDILTQVTAASNGLKKVAIELLDDHIRYCFTNQTGRDGDMVKEATAAIERLIKA